MATVTDDYSGTNKVFDYGANPYTVTPSVCNLSVKCLSVTPSNQNLPCQELDVNNQLTWNFPTSLYTDKVNGIAPGTYTFVYEVSTCGNVKENLSVQVILSDPCLSATIDTKPTTSEIVYTITDEGNTVPLSP